MNDDYDNFILYKYRLAVAIAILKNTPENLTPRKYLEQLKNNLISKMKSDDSDITICEDDFNVDDDDVIVNDDNDNNEKVKNDENENIDTELFDSKANDSFTILKDFDFNDIMKNMNNDNDENIMINNSVSDVLEILKGDDYGDKIYSEMASGNGDVNNCNDTQSTYYECSQTLLHQEKDPVNIHPVQIPQVGQDFSDTQSYTNYQINDAINHIKTAFNASENVTFDDSQRTQTVPENTDNFTYFSQSQVDNIIIPRYLIEKAKSNESKPNLSLNKPEINFNANVSKTSEKENISESSLVILNQTYRKADTDILIVSNAIKNNNNKHKYATQENDNIENIQVKRLKNDDIDKVNANTDTVYLDEIKSKFNMNNNTFELNLNNSLEIGQHDLSENNIAKYANVVDDSIYKFSQKINTDQNKTKRYIDIDIRNNSDNFHSQISLESNDIINKVANNSQILFRLSQEFDSEASQTETVVKATLNSAKQKTTGDDAEESEEEQIEDLFDKLTDSQVEVVPFKVIEELNKVKSYLNKRGSSECGSESGYKSDSQSKSSFKSALQSSNIWLNQSAYCLLDYIKQCALVVNTEDITNEISKILGRLIDRLHEDEKYPSFLEEHLHTVDNFLKEIYQDESDKVLKKDEIIHRLFLLNKSSHIIKYTTEKIIIILEDVLSKLTKEDLLEIFHTIQTENLSYIFHILETLIKKLVVYKNFPSQGTQNSQEDDVVLKKSSITDIWRNKWNPSKKPDVEPIGNDKPCVLVRCSDILNKIIVQAMDGYSLISYFALQCFNLLQN